MAVFFIFPPGKKTHLGLDLQGGLEVVFQAKTTSGGMPSSDEMSQTIGIMDRRVNGLGVTEAQVQKQGTDQISVALPGVTNQQQALEHHRQDGAARVLRRRRHPHRRSRPTPGRRAQERHGQIPKADMQKLQAYVKPSMPTRRPAARAGLPRRDYRHHRVPPAGIYLGNTSTALLPLPAQAGHDRRRHQASAAQSFDQQQQRPDVSINFTGPGGKQFERRSPSSWPPRRPEGPGPVVRHRARQRDGVRPHGQLQGEPQGISGGSAMITGNFTIQEAKDLALVLNTGALPVTLTPIEQQQVSAMLGKDSLHAGLIAGAIGLGLVLIFMVVVYRFLGLIADFALIIYAILLWGVFNAVPVTLTLPGIAGMILTIGVAADANVVVFERIKEEVRRGKSVRSAINSGYGKGFKTILDANILIILTALVLFYFATAQPKGFALTLMIGTVVSLFTAVLATRAMLGLLGNFAFFDKAEFMGVHAGVPCSRASSTSTAGLRPAAAAGARASRLRRAAPRAARAGRGPSREPAPVPVAGRRVR